MKEIHFYLDLFRLKYEIMGKNRIDNPSLDLSRDLSYLTQQNPEAKDEILADVDQVLRNTNGQVLFSSYEELQAALPKVENSWCQGLWYYTPKCELVAPDHTNNALLASAKHLFDDVDFIALRSTELRYIDIARSDSGDHIFMSSVTYTKLDESLSELNEIGLVAEDQLFKTPEEQRLLEINSLLDDVLPGIHERDQEAIESYVFDPDFQEKVKEDHKAFQERTADALWRKDESIHLVLQELKTEFDYDVPDNMSETAILGFIFIESMGKTSAGSQAGAKGLMQLMPNTFQAFRHPQWENDIYNPKSNVFAGTRYLLDEVAEFAVDHNPEGLPSWGLVIGAYNRGTTAMRRYMKNPHQTLPEETRKYIAKFIVYQMIERDLIL